VQRQGSGEALAPVARYLLTTAEIYPTHRVDLTALFGRYLPRHGIQTDWLALTRTHTPPPWPAGRLVTMRVRGRLGDLVGAFWQQLSLLVRAQRGYDGLIVRDQPVLGLIGFAAARLAGIPFIYWMSFPMPLLWAEVAARPQVPRWRRLYAALRAALAHAALDGVLIRRADHLFVQSRTMHEELVQQGLAHRRVTAVPMGVDLEQPLEAIEPQAAFSGRSVAVYLGALERRRRPDLLVDCALLVGRQRPDFLLVVIGEAEDPVDQGWARRYAQKRKAHSHVLFLGWQPFERAQALARFAQIGLSPFPRSPLLESASPTKAVEYLALGIPVVGNDQPDQAEVIRQSGGGLCVPLTAEDFAQAILTLLSDESKRRRMAECGQAWVAAHRSYAVLSARVAAPLKRLTKARPQDVSGGIARR
jgi:glycosyltransferase involved in cell wall biosynthesis